jgi:hypothetical protein
MYVTTTKGMRGWFAVLIDDSEGFPEPVSTGIGSFDTKEEAEIEAKEWALAEEVKFRP